MSRQFTLGEIERLKSRKAIEQLFESGKKFSISFFLVYYLFTGEEKKVPLQFGIGVSGKNFRKAVDRNRVKRLTREAYRLQKTPLKEKLVEKNKCLQVFFIYTGKTIPEYKQVYPVVGSIIEKLLTLVK
jgi:ribonuclease P protein component